MKARIFRCGGGGLNHLANATVDREDYELSNLEFLRDRQADIPAKLAMWNEMSMMFIRRARHKNVSSFIHENPQAKEKKNPTFENFSR